MDTLTDHLLSQTTIHVSGACGPHRTQPIECYYPQHHSYRHDVATRTAGRDGDRRGGCMRRMESARARNGSAVVFDRDVVTTWRLPSPMAAYEIFF